ncbi:ABC transporter permease [Streptomyces sp. SID12488]|uniref:ABC transporter permease n=1 Tax=Streptomyces sp. SID12488 TaxID=2706040 RepID=UPI0013DA1DF4|nr:ABC transporter permease [Streptomyces sp. SID12488]NEA64294.1 ABC transporter permease [Streptomyces sp. SID12488]
MTTTTLRTRWTAFTGSFVALSLGVALIAVMGLALAATLDAPTRSPERFAAAPLVVRGADTLRVQTPNGPKTQQLAHPRPVPPKIVAQLRALGRVVEDRTFAVRADTSTAPDDLLAHPWSTAAFAPYTLTEGRPPRTAAEAVVTGDWTNPGDRVPTAYGTVRIVGRVSPPGTAPGFENAMFLTDTWAAELAPYSTQLVVDTDDVTAVREAVRGADGVTVLTGGARRLADAGPDRDREALTTLNALFGTAGGVTGFVSVFVVASTFAFTVAQRQREFGLLRTAGATPGQLRRMVLAEALTVGVLASATGCVLGAYGAPRLVGWTVEAGVAPPWFALGDQVWPYHLAFWTGLLVALCGVVSASWRAGRTAPTEVLREAAPHIRPLPRTRLLAGAALLLTAVLTLAVSLLTDPSDLLHRKTYTSRPLFLITATALLAPVLVRPLIGFLTRPLARLPGATVLLARENTTANVRRTAAIAAPVLVTVALTGSLLGATATLTGARATELRNATTADLVVTAPPGAAFDAQLAARLRTLPGVAEVSATAPTAVYVLEEGVALIKSEARTADPAPLAATADLPVTSGRVTDLDDDSIVVNEEWERHTVGDQVTVWLGNGTKRSLRIAATLATGTGDNGAYVTPVNAREARPDRLDVTLAADANTPSTTTDLRRAISRTGGQLLTKSQWLRASSPPSAANPTTRVGLFLVLGIALAYTGISLANTMTMATSDRSRELAALRLAGATRRQVLGVVGAEALLMVTVGAVLGLLVTALNLLGMWSALRVLSVRTSLELPWPALATTTTACAALAVASALAPAAVSLRRRPVDLAGIRE